MKSHDSYFVNFFKYLTSYVLQTCYVDENRHFLYTYSAKNPAKIPCFSDFFSKNFIIFSNFHVYFQCIQISCHMKFNVLILVSMDRGGPLLYIGSKYI